MSPTTAAALMALSSAAILVCFLVGTWRARSGGYKSGWTERDRDELAKELADERAGREDDRQRANARAKAEVERIGRAVARSEAVADPDVERGLERLLLELDRGALLSAPATAPGETDGGLGA